MVRGCGIVYRGFRVYPVSTTSVHFIRAFHLYIFLGRFSTNRKVAVFLQITKFLAQKMTTKLPERIYSRVVA